jgi:hypothetical protein
VGEARKSYPTEDIQILSDPIPVIREREHFYRGSDAFSCGSGMSEVPIGSLKPV